MSEEIITILMPEELLKRVRKETDKLNISQADYICYATETLLRLNYSEVLMGEISKIIEEEVWQQHL